MSLKDELLKYYQLSEAEYASLCLSPDIRNIPFIDDDIAVKMALKRIQEALHNDEKILIYGDYDCDGIMATSIMVASFKKLGKAVASYIPSRYLDGYGLTLANAEKIVASGYNLVILVDNGVSCEEEVAYLLSKGVETIIIDHHGLPASLPPCIALIHPQTLKYGSYPVSAGYLSFLFSTLLLKEVDPYLLILGAISTISDMMPLKGHNREIVRLALRYLNTYDYPPIRLLTSRSQIDEEVLAMEIIPKINAIGRVVEDSKINRCVTYFASPSSPQSEALARWMDENNEHRKNLSKTLLENLSIDDQEEGIFVLTDLKEGINGLLANRILQTYHKPVIVASPSSTDPSCYVGSLRSQEGFYFPLFTEEVSSLLVRYGGHGFAGGITFKKENASALKVAFLKYASAHPLQKKEIKEIELPLKEITPESYSTIKTFGPFGFEWPKPEFIIPDVPTLDLTYTREGTHLSTLLPTGVKLLGFHMGREEVSKTNSIALHGTFTLSEWKGRTNIEFRANAFDSLI